MPVKKTGFIGLGLIGGSIAKAIRQYHPDCEILAFDKNKETKISLFNSQTKKEDIFNDDEDFKNNAKIDGILLKDIWDDTTDRYWLQ